ncbi:methanethiol S-methyltransferase [Tsuneonella sp. HG222]
MAAVVSLLFAAASYAIFFATFLYLIAFTGDMPFVPVTVDRGLQASPILAAVINVGLIATFGLQHSVMARKGFKQAWTRIVPKHLERSVYVLAASLALILLFALWHPIGATVWSVENPLGRGLLWALFATGWVTVLVSTFLLNHFELFGLQQTWFHARRRESAAPVLREPFFYRFVRHPLYSGFLLAFWAIPVMSVGHLLLAAGMTVYILIAIRHEERDLVDLFGQQYVDYRARVGMLTPRMGRPK